MDPELVKIITKNIHRRFPNFNRVKPKVRKQPLPKEQREKIHPDKRNYLLTFKKNAVGPNGQVIPRWVRVVATPRGKIVKITTSK
jgi:hypothetical protein